MSRLALLALLLASACSKSAPPPAASPSGGPSTGDVVAVPGAAPTGGPSMGKPAEAKPVDVKPAAGDDRSRLQPQEGKLAVDAPADAKAGSETTAHVTVTPGAGFHVNTEYPVKLTLETPQGVTLGKTEFKAGGHDQGKGDADAFDEKQLAFSVKLTPSASGDYTVNGSFKFAVCDASQCLPKKETIAIKVAAK
ncbi:MAG TPA: hypothetical protein VGC42_23665 [Kofleriaceae bacterium]